jgi:hypothetical protein
MLRALVFFLGIIALSGCQPTFRLLTSTVWQVDQVIFPPAAEQQYNEVTRKAILKQLREKSSFTFKKDSTLHLVLPVQNVFLKWWLSADKKKICVLGEDSVVTETAVSELTKNQFRFVTRDVGGNDIVLHLIPKP